tara:strand:+ start:52 stop:573 length:522 start_codon:yes stop_codon:yes gene_type:complete
MILSSENYKEPLFDLLSKDGNIEIRKYSKCIIAKTSIDTINLDDNNMFRTLASYIFGSNKENKKIPMTAPVTTYQKNSSYNMIFYMLDANEISQLPETNGQSIEFETLDLGKCAVIPFSWFTTDARVSAYSEKLINYIEDNGFKQLSPIMVNRYDPPWRLPFLRRNEVLVQID